MMNAAERVRRYRARMRGEPIEKMRPGPVAKPKPPKPPRVPKIKLTRPLDTDNYEMIFQTPTWRIWGLIEDTEAEHRFRVDQKRSDGRWRKNQRLSRSLDFALFVEECLINDSSEALPSTATPTLTDLRIEAT